jgi:TPR repeat protein
MIARARASLEALVGRDLSGLLSSLACVLSLAAMCFSTGTAAGVLGAGERAYARHDYVRAAPLLLAEAERGSPIAQTYIGFMFQNGLGVPRDYAAAAGWFNLAAQQGAPTAQFLLGLLFDKGYGVPQDWVQAEVWLNLAASQASSRQRDYWAQIRDSVAQKLTLDQLAEAQRRAYDWAPIAISGGARVSARY